MMIGKRRLLSVVVGLALLLALASGCSIFGGPAGARLDDAASAGQGPAAAQATPPSGPSAPLSIPQIVDRIKPAVVQIANVQNVQAGSSRQTVEETAGIGSGVIYDPSGLILTNNHVIEGAQGLKVALTDGRVFDGQLVGADPQTDLAVVRVSAADLPVAPLGSTSSLTVGDWVVAIGNALALTGGPTVTQGIVSALDRAIQEPPDSSQPGTPSGSSPGVFLYDLIQTDAAINPGNSGGPLLNLQSQVVGINTLVASTTDQGTPVEGIGFAISIDTAKMIASQLVATGHAVHPYLGIEYTMLNPALAARLNVPVQRGAYITAVTGGAPAAQAGLRQGDAVIAIDGQQVATESSLGRIINQHKPGDVLTLTIVRNGQKQDVQVTLGTMP